MKFEGNKSKTSRRPLAGIDSTQIQQKFEHLEQKYLNSYTLAHKPIFFRMKNRFKLCDVRTGEKNTENLVHSVPVFVNKFVEMNFFLPRKT